MKKLVVFEPHPYHFEVIPGILYYFDKLGYDIDVYVRENFESNDILGECAFKNHISVYKYQIEEMFDILSNSSIKKYDYIFFSSMEFFHDGIKERILDYLGFVPNTKYGIMGIYHNIAMINDNDLDYIKEGRVFALTESSYKGNTINLFSTLYYGEYNLQHTLNSKRKIIMIGLSNDKYIIQSALSKSRYHIRNKLSFGYIGKRGHKLTNLIFMVLCLIGKIIPLGEKYNKSPAFIGWSKIKYFGNLGFQDMYKQIIDSDFIAVFMDPNDPEKKDFLNGKTTGAKQLILAFEKPGIICKEFGEAFGFSADNSFLYENNDLVNELSRFVEISQEQYIEYQKNLRVLKLNMMETTMQNICKCISNTSEGEEMHDV